MSSNANFENFGDTMSELGGFGLARQSSVYSLTFDEFQSSLGSGLGKDFGSMNMDELLKSIWSAEETQLLGSSSGVGGGAGAAGSGGFGTGTDLPGGSHLQRQGSITLPRTMSQKTVDEVWKDLYKESEGAKEFGNNNGAMAMESSVPQRQPTLGEMTLEEFLVKAGIVKKDCDPGPQIEKPIINNNNNGVISNTTANDSAFGLLQPIRNNNNKRVFDNGVTQQITNNNINSNTAMSQPPILPVSFGGARPSQPPPPQPHQHQVFPKLPAATTTSMSFATTTPMHSQLNSSAAARQRNGAMVGLTDPTSLVPRRGVVPLPPSMGNNRVAPAVAAMPPVSQIPQEVMIKADIDSPGSLSPVPYLFNRRGKCGAALEKVIERRQKRMIKNRESAARSRARKQAYTMELEAEVAKLKEINDELQRKQEEIIEIQKNQILEAINQQWGSKRPCLKRTYTGPW